MTDEAWYEANLALYRKCQALQAELNELQAQRPELVVKYCEELAPLKRLDLAARVHVHGKQGRHLALHGNKASMVEFLITVRLEPTDTRIVELKRQIEASVPSPYWRMQREDAQ